MKSERTLPSPGDELVHHFRKRPGSVVAKVISVNSQTGEIVLQIGKRTFPSLSAAAAAISGHASNGWVYWGLKKQQPKK